jgi:hypothetical protein
MTPSAPECQRSLGISTRANASGESNPTANSASRSFSP